MVDGRAYYQMKRMTVGRWVTGDSVGIMQFHVYTFRHFECCVDDVIVYSWNLELRELRIAVARLV